MMLTDAEARAEAGAREDETPERFVIMLPPPGQPVPNIRDADFHDSAGPLAARLATALASEHETSAAERARRVAAERALAEVRGASAQVVQQDDARSSTSNKLQKLLMEFGYDELGNLHRAVATASDGKQYKWYARLDELGQLVAMDPVDEWAAPAHALGLERYEGPATPVRH